ncbi:MAG: hypothetical protein ACE5F4_02980, partial [Candidatus Paceibacteria bacterium]
MVPRHSVNDTVERPLLARSRFSIALKRDNPCQNGNGWGLPGSYSIHRIVSSVFNSEESRAVL